MPLCRPRGRARNSSRGLAQGVGVGSGRHLVVGWAGGVVGVVELPILHCTDDKWPVS
jgi:hypothetical protein